MSMPVPTPGLVINYGFLWSNEAKSGALEGSKDRPCAIIVAARKGPNGKLRVVLAPITHSPPEDPSNCLEFTPQQCTTIGLDGERQWLRFDELNSFEWPGFDLRPIRGKHGQYVYGKLPKQLFEFVRQAIVTRAHSGRLKSPINRDD